jgi:NADPH:quinone reductase-like Zn-dependent oxidoreductase
MRAILLDRYGPPTNLRLGEIDKPEPKPDQVLVRVRAASVNALDWHVIRADPFIVRIGGGFRGPKDPRVGRDAAGIVEAVGANVMDLRVGDEVFGVGEGAFAEYVAGSKFALKPSNLTYEEAAAIPIAGCTALQTVRDQAEIQPGQRVAIIGAGGGVGSFAVQLAKEFGAHVTATTATDKVEFVRSLGADEVLDYSQEDISRQRPFDAVLDIGGRGSIRSLRPTLTPSGTLVLVAAGRGFGGPLGRIAAAMIRSRVLKQRVIFAIASITHADLAALKELVEAGRIRPVVDQVYPMAEAAAAVTRVEREEACGKVVITV